MGLALKRDIPALIIADADGFVDARDEDLAVPDTARSGRSDDGLNGPFYHTVSHYQFQLDLWQQVNRVFPPSVKFSVTFLAAVTTCFQNRDAGNAGLHQSILYSVQPGRLNDGFNLLHCDILSDLVAERLEIHGLWLEDLSGLPIVAFLPMLGEVQTDALFFLSDPQPDQLVYEEQNDQSADD